MPSETPLSEWIKIGLSEDLLTAYIKIVKLPAKWTVTSEEIFALLGKNGIRHGILYDVIHQIVHDPQPFVQTETVIAKGEPPGDGADGQIRTLYNVEDKTAQPAQMHDGTVDYREIIRLANVRKGQRIAERIPPETGSPGITVTGEPIPGRTGKEARFKIGKNVVADSEKKALYAAIDGMVVMTENGNLNVFPVYEVQGDVDYRVGNIDFVGTVIIHGNVLAGFKVRADGDIRVFGGVESAFVEASGSVEVSAGILGHQKGVVRAGVNVKSSFIQDAVVEAGEDVIVSQSILHSRIRAGKGVYCRGPKGLIVGGSIQAGKIVIARTIGNTTSTPTVIEVGVLPELRNEMAALRARVKDLQESVEKAEKAIAILDQYAASGTISADKIALRVKLGQTKKLSSEELLMIRDRILELEKALEQSEEARVDAISAIYAGTKIVIGRYTKNVKDSVSRVSFRYSDGDIVMFPIQ